MHEAMELKVLNTGGTETGEVVTLRDDIFGAEISEHAMYLDVKSILANRRQGTHKSKTRGEVRGGGRKLKVRAFIMIYPVNNRIDRVLNFIRERH